MPAALGALLTTETLLFAGTSVAIALSAGSALGQRRRISAFALAAAAAALLVVVATGAVAVWWDAYGDDWPRRFSGQVTAACVLIGILAQPAFAVAVALNVRG